MEYKGFKYTIRVCPDSIYVSIDRESVSSLHLPVKATQDGLVVPGIGSQRPLLRLEYTMDMPSRGVAVSDLLNNVHRHMDESLAAWEHQSTCTLTEAASIVQKANKYLTCSYADSMVKWVPLTFEALDNPVGYCWIPGEDGSSTGELYRNPAPFR